jgi:Holliday junction resolvase RusA-like endonuclease
MKVTLPAPPSMNAIWRAVGGRVIKSEVYRAWIRHAGLELMAQRPKAITGPVKVEVLCVENGRRDLDGHLKAVLDLMVTHKLIDGDRCKTVREITMSWSKEVKGVEVHILAAVGMGDTESRGCHGPANHGP